MQGVSCTTSGQHADIDTAAALAPRRLIVSRSCSFLVVIRGALLGLT